MGQVCGSEECEGTVEDMQSNIVTKENERLKLEAEFKKSQSRVMELRESTTQGEALLGREINKNTALTKKLQALRYIVAEYNEEVRQGCPADELPDLEKALADSEKE